MQSLLQHRHITKYVAGLNLPPQEDSAKIRPVSRSSTLSSREQELGHVATTTRDPRTSQHSENDASGSDSTLNETNQAQGQGDDKDVTSDAHGDPADVQNWPNPLRIRTFLIVWLLVFAEGWVSACDGTTTAQASMAFHVSQTAETCATGLFLIGLSTGSLIAGPLSETFGRNPVYLISTAVFLCFTLGAALAPNFGAQIVFRLLAGICSSPTLSLYGGTLADLFTPKERSYAWPYFALSPLLGPVLAPLAGGWIAEYTSFRWVYWIGLMLSGIAFLVALLFLPETFSPVLLLWKAKALRARTGDESYKSSIDQQEALSKRFSENLKRPAVFWTSEPVVIFLGAYLCLIYVVNFTFLDGFGFIFTDTYGLSKGYAALGFVAIAMGALLSTALNPIFLLLHKRLLRPGTRTGIRDAEKMTEGSDSEDDIEATGPPELRLLATMCASPFFCISLFWLGWTNYAHISVWSAYAACVVFGYSLTAIFIGSYAYIIDVYGQYAGSALGSITLARYLASGGMVIASRPMYQGIGVHWTMTLMGTLATLLVPVPWVLYVYGRRISSRSKFAS